MKKMDEVKDRVLGPVGTPRRDNYEKELKEELAPFKEAKQLVNSFMPWVKASYTEYENPKQEEYYLHISKECALVAVHRVESALIDFVMEGSEMENLDLTHWEKVKTEIRNLQLSQL